MVIPLYQSEVAPKEIRGRLVAVQVKIRSNIIDSISLYRLFSNGPSLGVSSLRKCYITTELD